MKAKRTTARATRSARRVLAIDVGGTHVKILATGQKVPRKIPSGPKMTARQMVAAVKNAAADWSYDVVSIGYPGPVIHDRPLSEPANLGKGWVRFDFGRAFGKPFKMINDAAMQALGSYRGGRMLFLGLGTGLGSALIVKGELVPLELARLRHRDGEVEDYVGLRGLKRHGEHRWRKHVAEVVAMLRSVLIVDYVVLGGGNARLVRDLPEGCRLGGNAFAFTGGERLWSEQRSATGQDRSAARAAPPLAGIVGCPRADRVSSRSTAAAPCSRSVTRISGA
jgi:polyphosphate glucokinase